MKGTAMQGQAKRVILATRNMGKVVELAGPLAEFGMEVVGLEACAGIGEIEENGSSFEENALIKARVVASHTGQIAVADDSGLEVDALGGGPGIYSARYADDLPLLEGESHDARNIRKLLQAMAHVPEEARTCRFVCCMAAVLPDGRALTVRGLWQGQILRTPCGDNGFGYDPIFFDPHLVKSAAQLSRSEKIAVSHRGQAVRALLRRWGDFVF